MTTPDNPTLPPVAKADGSKLSGAAVERSLSPEQWSYLEQRLFAEGWTYRRVASDFLQRFGIKLSLAALNRIWHQEMDRRTLLQARLERIRASARSAQEVRQAAAESAPQTSEAVLSLIQQRAFDLSLDPACDLNALATLTRLLLQARGQTLEREKFAAATKSAVEKGLDALFSEIKGNSEAEQLFTRLKDVVTQAIA